MLKITRVGQKVVRHLFERQNLLVHLKSQLLNLQHGKLTIKLPYSQTIQSQKGIFQSGVVSMLCDVSSGLAACTLLKNQQDSAVTVQLKINFLSPAKGQFLLGHGKVIKQTQSLIFTDAEIFNQQGQMCAYVIQTIKRILPQQNPSMKVL